MRLTDEQIKQMDKAMAHTELVERTDRMMTRIPMIPPSREEIQFRYTQAALRPLIHEQAENLLTVMHDHITGLQTALQPDEELLVYCDAGREMIRVFEFRFPRWNVAILSGLDPDGNKTQHIAHINTIQLTCKIRKATPDSKRVTIGFILPEAPREKRPARKE